MFTAARKILMLFFALSVVGCGQKQSGEGSKRDYSFYSHLINPSDQYQQAAANLHEFKLMISNEKYSMRVALFDNGVFYYEVNNLGDGEGTWEYRDGVLKLKAVRTIFDMELEIMAESSESDATIVQFVDRFRFNSVPMQLRQPSADGKPLSVFKKSKLNI